MTPSGLEEKSARPSAWVVRAGASGEFAEEFLSHQIVAIGFSPTGNVAGMTRDEVTRAVSSWGRSPQGARMLFEFASEIKIGDLIITPAPGAESALVGSVGGDYEYAEDPPIDDLHHSRKMRWRGWVSTGTLEASSVNNLKLRPTLYKPGEQEKLLGLAELPLVRGNPTSPDAMTFHDNIWLEITDRNNIGTDLTGGQRRQDGGTSSHYSLAKTIRPGDLVFHWDKRRGAIVGRSFTEGQLEEVGEHWLFPLRGYVELERPVTLAKLRAKEQEIREIHRRHKQASPDKLFFPFQLSDTRPLRPAEQYLARFPLEIVDIFEELANIPVRPLNISDLLENALELLQQREAGSPFSVERLEEIVIRSIPARLESIAGRDIAIRGRTRIGTLADVPWVGLFPSEEQASATRGYYLVYLFAKDGSAAFLSLNQGTEFVKGGLEVLQKRSIDLRRAAGDHPDLLTDIDLRSDNTRPKKYEAGSAYALRYEQAAIPSDNELERDLRRMLSILRDVEKSGLVWDPEREPLHLLFKWNADKEPRTIDLHKEIADRETSVWWGRFSRSTAPSISPSKLSQVQEQIASGVATHAYLYRRGSVWRTHIQEATVEPPSSGDPRFPRYYKPEECNFFVRLSKWEELSPDWLPVGSTQFPWTPV